MLELRTPKGTIDYSPRETMLISKIIDKSISIFKKHGAVCIDTPTFELKEILTNKYGEDSKLIFDLADQGGDICSLRYDLTVPFARYLASNKIAKIKRYQIGKVFRRDNPVVTKGRLREFTQCDFDIAGNYLEMTADAEIIKICVECLSSFDLGQFCISINHRKILSAIFKIASIPSDLHLTVCSSIDKIDKIQWEAVKLELITKGIDDSQAEIIKKYISKTGSTDLLNELKNDTIYGLEEGKEAIDDLLLLMKYIKIYKIENIVQINLSLARGLDYYTGIIFEASFKQEEVGAVIGGGRYDNLVDGILKSANRKDFTVPCVGFSVGITRIYTLMQKKYKNIKDNDTLVLVVSSGDQFLENKMEILNELWDNNIPAESVFTKRNDFLAQLKYCEQKNIKFCLIIGQDEINSNSVKIKNILKDENFEYIQRDDLVGFIEKNRI
ncbi:hypothetical protein LUQ84_002438 [Hamiltosporidium tvaerminnensis]|nr:hypothetical protein LUQ84_002438 [Hamiltosporidium tvaerminnensis]